MLLPPVGDRPLPQAMLVVHQGLTWKITYLRFQRGSRDSVVKTLLLY